MQRASAVEEQSVRPKERTDARAIPAADDLSRAVPAPAVGGPAAMRLLGDAGDDGSRQRLFASLQRSAGNAAVSEMLWPPPEGPRQAPQAGQPGRAERVSRPAQDGPVVEREPVVQRVGVSTKHNFTSPDFELGSKDLSYAKATLAVSGTVEYEVTPPTGPPGSVTPGGESSGLGSNKAPEGGGGTKVSGGMNVTKEGGAYQAEISHEFEKRTEGWLAGWVPKAKIGGEAGAGGYKLGLEGSIEGQNIEPKFGFLFFEADNKGEIKFAQLEVGVDIKLSSFKYTCSDGATAQVSIKPTVKVKIEPNYARLLTWFLEECATAVTAEMLIVGSFVAGGLLAVGGALLTIGEGEEYAKAIDDAAKARTDYVNAFVAQITTGNAPGDNEYTAGGRSRGDQWINNLKLGTGAKGVPIPESVLKEKVKEHQAEATAKATAAVNAQLHALLVRRYWEIHYIQKAMGIEHIDNVYKMLMEAVGFGQPKDGETGEEPVEQAPVTV